MMQELRELLPERRLRPLMRAAEEANGFRGAHAIWRIARLPEEVFTDELLGEVSDLEVKACLWFRKTWSGRDGSPRREAGYALAIYIPGRDERHLYLEHDLDAALAHLSGFGYDPEEKCWRLATYGEVGSHLVSKDADVLWNRDDFSRDLIELAQ
jgi:hypothetical protein